MPEKYLTNVVKMGTTRDKLAQLAEERIGK